MTDHEINEMIRFADSSGEGEIDIMEFLKILKKTNVMNQSPSLRGYDSSATSKNRSSDKLVSPKKRVAYDMHEDSGSKIIESSDSLR